MTIDGNNYDFSQGDSCLRTHVTCSIGVREQSTQFILAFDRLLSSIDNETLLISQIRNLQLLENIANLDRQALNVNKTNINNNRSFFSNFL